MRLIDADALIEKADSLFKDLNSTEDYMGIGYNHGVGDCMAIVKNIPTVDAVPLEDYQSMERTVNKLTQAIAKAEPVKRGKWDMGRGIAICDVCGNAPSEFYIDNSEYWRYCPNCGAKMNTP